MADDNTQQQPPPPQYDLQSPLGQMPQIPQAPQPDQTPVSQGWLSKLGEVLGAVCRARWQRCRRPTGIWLG